ncbi:MAG: copper homeostasis protein CutC [Treponema sp.]|jgi:copper homeostasis protein|nr:copper homeostasis protein CutC [Treponema sp.]
MGRVLVEVCCASVEDVLEAEKGGADRVELNSDLFHGGLTPSIGEVIVAKEMSCIPVMAMVRPRPGGFCYTDTEFKTAMADCKSLLCHGADGIVFGFLHSDGTLDFDRCKAILDIIGEKESVFHRAIDVVSDWRKTLDDLVSIGVRRVLTSGQEPDVFWGADTIREMIRHAAGRIEILPGAGVTIKNAAALVEKTGCTQIHIAKSIVYKDSSTKNNRSIFYGGMLYPPEDEYTVIDSSFVTEVKGIVS